MDMLKQLSWGFRIAVNVFLLVEQQIVKNFHQLNLVNIVVNFCWRYNITKFIGARKKFCPKVLQYFFNKSDFEKGNHVVPAFCE